MYRILAAHGETQDRRQQRQHPTYTKPELLATAPNQLWSWDSGPRGDESSRGLWSRVDLPIFAPEWTERLFRKFLR
jgi:hypothetical protein